jgi:glutamate--cysteine ligase
VIDREAIDRFVRERCFPRVPAMAAAFDMVPDIPPSAGESSVGGGAGSANGPPGSPGNGRRGVSPRRIGAEYEMLALRAADRRPASLDTELLPWLERYARRVGWMLCPSSKGAPRFVAAGGGAITFEPGGQLEYAAPPRAIPGDLVDDLRSVMEPLTASAASAGIILTAAGIDPFNRLSDAPLQVKTPRYATMHEYFAALGEAGPRMMRQTAAIQVSVDFGDDPLLQWRVLNAAAPVLTALFAASGCYAGADTGCASFRAHSWRQLDPVRTGILSGDDPIADYAAFAAAAPPLLPPSGSQAAMLEDHFSTLFPDIRPRGYLEVRSMDTVPIAAVAAPLLLLDALAGPTALREAAALLGRADPVLLHAAGVEGLRNPALRDHAVGLLQIVRRAWRQDPVRYRTEDVAAAERWFAGRMH